MKRVVLALVGLAAVAVAAAFVLLPEGEDEPYPRYEGNEPIETSVAEIVDVTQLWYRKPVELSGIVREVDDERFVLDGKEQSILVRPEPATIDDDIGPGDRVTVVGVVNRLNRLQAAELRELRRTRAEPALSRPPIAEGAPFVSADYVG